MRITLINSHIKIFRVEPHGILMIAACLEREGHKIQLIDGLFEAVNYDEIKKFDPDIIGISVMTLTYSNAKEIICNLKKILPKKKIILGGVHPTALPKESLINLKADFLITGDGETTIVELCNELKKKKAKRNFDKIKGIAFIKGGNIVVTPRRELIKNLDLLPFPARHLLDMRKYLLPPGSIRGFFFRRIATVITSRGCPFRCIYCDHKRIYRQRSVYYVIKELKFLKTKYNIEGVNFLDQDIMINKDWMKALCKEIKKLKLFWSCSTRVTSPDANILRMMKGAGCLQIDFGMESGSNKILQVLKKDITVDQIRKRCELIRKTGIRFSVNILVGSPDETKEDLDKTYNLLREIKPDFGSVNFLTVIPGTELYENCLKEGKKFNYYITKKGLPYKYFSLTNLSKLTDKELMFYQKRFRNYLLKRKLKTLLEPDRMHFLFKIFVFLLTNPIIITQSSFKVVIKHRDYRIYKKIYDLVYEIQRRFYLKNKLKSALFKKVG